MGVVRVWNGGNNSNPRDSVAEDVWDVAAPSIASALGHSTQPVQTGDIILVASDHSVLATASLGWTFPGNNLVVSVNRATGLYEYGGREQTNANYVYTYIMMTNYTNRWLEFRGMQLGARPGYSYSWMSIGYERYGLGRITFRDCLIKNSGHATASGLYLGYSSGTGGLYATIPIVFTNCRFDHSSGARTLLIYSYSGGCRLTIENCSILNPGSLAHLLYTSGLFAGPIIMRVRDMDLSNFTYIASKDGAGGNRNKFDLRVAKCRMKSGFKLMSNPEPIDEAYAEYCSVGEITATPIGVTQYQRGSHGFVTQDRTVYRTGSDGELNYSLKMEANTNTSRGHTLQLPVRLSVWHDATASKTLRIYMVCSASDLTDADVYATVSSGNEDVVTYATGKNICTLGSYGSEAGVSSSTYLKDLGDTDDWTGSGFSAGVGYYIEIPNINPQEPGEVLVQIDLARASATLWVCPYAELS